MSNSQLYWVRTDKGKDKCNSAFKVILIVFVLHLTDENETQIKKHGMDISGIDLAFSLHFKAILH
jgi:hypothetical protein